MSNQIQPSRHLRRACGGNWLDRNKGPGGNTKKRIKRGEELTINCGNIWFDEVHEPLKIDL